MADGTTRNVRGSELVQLATMAYEQLESDQNSMGSTNNSEPATPEEMTTEERLAETEKRLATLDLQAKQQQEANRMQQALMNARKTNEITQSSDKFHNLLSTVTVAKVSINPRLDYEATYKETLADTLEIIKGIEEGKNNKEVASELLRNSTMGTRRGNEGGSLVDTSKEFKAEDLKSGASRTALINFLKASRR